MNIRIKLNRNMFLIAVIMLLPQSLLVSSAHAGPEIDKKPVVEERGIPFVTRGITDSKTGMEFVALPGGCFQMGSNDGSDAKPVHEVCVSDFAIGKYEVTQGQWKKVFGNNPSHFSSCGDECPVESVSWDDVQQFIERLNSQTGAEYRLPTEAEWEFAARSGGNIDKYSGGDDVDTVAWYSGNSGSKTYPVGQKQANGLGLFDMSGNVWEWVSDWYDSGYYSKSPRNNPQGPTGGASRVFRGGSWFNVPKIVRTTFRFKCDPGGHNHYLGFRLVLASVR